MTTWGSLHHKSQFKLLKVDFTYHTMQMRKKKYLHVYKSKEENDRYYKEACHFHSTKKKIKNI